MQEGAPIKGWNPRPHHFAWLTSEEGSALPLPQQKHLLVAPPLAARKTATLRARTETLKGLNRLRGRAQRAEGATYPPPPCDILCWIACRMSALRQVRPESDGGAGSGAVGGAGGEGPPSIRQLHHQLTAFPPSLSVSEAGPSARAALTSLSEKLTLVIPAPLG